MTINAKSLELIPFRPLKLPIKQGTLQTIPPELFSEILSSLSLETVFTLASVNSHFYNLTRFYTTLRSPNRWYPLVLSIIDNTLQEEVPHRLPPQEREKELQKHFTAQLEIQLKEEDSSLGDILLEHPRIEHVPISKLIEISSLCSHADTASLCDKICSQIKKNPRKATDDPSTLIQIYTHFSLEEAYLEKIDALVKTELNDTDFIGIYGCAIIHLSAQPQEKKRLENLITWLNKTGDLSKIKRVHLQEAFFKAHRDSSHVNTIKTAFTHHPHFLEACRSSSVLSQAIIRRDPSIVSSQLLFDIYREEEMDIDKFLQGMYMMVLHGLYQLTSTIEESAFFTLAAIAAILLFSFYSLSRL